MWLTAARAGPGRVGDGRFNWSIGAEVIGEVAISLLVSESLPVTPAQITTYCSNF
jgi:hypothetical protein